MTLGRRVWLSAGLVGLLCTGYGGFRWQRMIESQQPAFIELPEGPRAPSLKSLLGLKLGSSPLSEVRQSTANLKCVDRSISTQLRQGLEKAERAMVERGENPWRYRIYGFINPHGRNPQVRWDCAAEDGSLIGESKLDEARILFVFDSENAPLRHTSLQRTWRDEASTRADVAASLARLTQQFGPPTANTRAAQVDVGPLLEATVYSWEWRWADLRVELNLVRYPEGRFVIAETEEIPWPVRSDLPRAPKQPER